MTRLLAWVGCGLCLVASVAETAQRDAATLPRRGWFGVALGPHPDGAAVTAVVEGSTAAAEGILAGDVIRAVDAITVRAPGDVIVGIGRHAAGETAVIDLVRGGRQERRPVVLRPLLREALAGVSFDYGSVSLDDGSRLRTIVSTPDRAAGRLPAVMLVQGGGCGSVDMPMAPDVAQPGLMRTIGARGYVTLRVEKSGVGDSQGPPCDAIGYTQELAGYRAALVALKRHPLVDPARVTLLGISLGGVFAPILARASPVHGVVVYGTLAGPPSPYPGRSERFFQEFAAVDVLAAWRAVDARVLALHGQYDEGTFAADHARIASAVNARRAAAAVHRELQGLDHCWSFHDSLEASRDRCGAGRATSALSAAVLEFLRQLG